LVLYYNYNKYAPNYYLNNDDDRGDNEFDDDRHGDGFDDDGGNNCYDFHGDNDDDDNDSS
jgi:hypothetical protein